MKCRSLSSLIGFLVILITAGCAEEQPPQYNLNYPLVPTYRPQAAGPNTSAPAAQSATAAGSANPATAAAPQAAPGPQLETAPSSPGPDYVWMPSYWTTGLTGEWVWIGGHYVARQAVPDEQLRAARGILEQARTGLTGKRLKRVSGAIDEINDALRVD